MQLLLSAFPGLEQRVKSERIWGTALSPGWPHSSGLETMTCSLMAKSAWGYVSSGIQTGRSSTYTGTGAERRCSLFAEAT